MQAGGVQTGSAPQSDTVHWISFVWQVGVHNTLPLVCAVPIVTNCAQRLSVRSQPPIASWFGISVGLRANRPVATSSGHP